MMKHRKPTIPAILACMLSLFLIGCNSGQLHSASTKEESAVATSVATDDSGPSDADASQKDATTTKEIHSNEDDYAPSDQEGLSDEEIEHLLELQDTNIFVITSASENGVALTPKPASIGLNDDTIIGNLTVTFGGICDALEKAAPDSKKFPREFYRQIVSCELYDNNILKESFSTRDINLVLAYYASIAYEMGDDKTVCENMQLFSEFPSSLLFVIKKADGKTENWVWDKDDNSFFVGPDEYKTTMFDDDVLSRWRDAIEETEGM